MGSLSMPRAGRIIGRMLLVAGGLLCGLGLGYVALAGYLVWRETVAPSARVQVALADGRSVALVQPTPPPGYAFVAAPAAGEAAPTPPAEAVAVPLPAAAPAAPAPPIPAAHLPPAAISIPAIGVAWPVVLADNQNLPAFQGVGWLMGSAFPGFPGNMVLFGHLGGPHATFGRLHELRPGDEFSVETAGAAHRYRVREAFETTPDDVGVLAPTDRPVATLITCAGPWDALAQTNERRLIVVADYVGAVARP